MHPRISINSLSVNAGSLAANIDAVARIGAAAISPGIDEVEATGVAQAVTLLRDAGLGVATFTHRAFGLTVQATAPEVDRLDRTIDVAAQIGAQSITMTTGGRGALSWTNAAARFADAIAPSAERARAAGVALSVEPTSHLYADASIAHRLSDLVAICTGAGVGLGIDIFACWFDSDIEQAIQAAAPLCQVVQVSDYVAGDRGLPCRAIPGDGMAQTDRLIGLIEAAGYTGPYDLEIIGPRIESEGAEAALRRAMTHIAAHIGSPK